MNLGIKSRGTGQTSGMKYLRMQDTTPSYILKFDEEMLHNCAPAFSLETGPCCHTSAEICQRVPGACWLCPQCPGLEGVAAGSWGNFLPSSSALCKSAHPQLLLQGLPYWPLIHCCPVYSPVCIIRIPSEGIADLMHNNFFQCFGGQV